MAVLTYSPSHVDPALLERLTIGASRHHLLGTLVEAVRAEVGREAHQHHLLIGPRGSGKTHILTLTAHRLRSDPALGSHTLPLTLAEEVVASHPADLMRRVLLKLSDTLNGINVAGAPTAQRGVGAALAALRSEPDDDRALEIAMGALEEASEALGRLLVPVVENLNLLLYSGPGLSRRSETPGQWALRRALLEARGVLLLAASPTLFGEVCDPQAPFYDFFRMHRLEELHPEEMLDLIRTRLALELESDGFDASRRARLQALSDHFEERTPKLRGLLTLTGGLPRFAHLLFDLLAETDVPRIVDLLAQFLDKQTPYFQPYLDPRMHPEAELEVLDRLASAEGPLMPREIAAGVRAGSVNAISTYLKRLRERGLVRQLGTSRKDIRYDLTEPLFRVWRRFRLGRNEREQVVLIAEFIAAMFEPSQLHLEWSQLDGVETAAFRRQVLEAALERQGWSVALQPHMLIEESDSKISAILDEARREHVHGSQKKAFELFGEAVKELRNEKNGLKLASILIEFSHVALVAGQSEHALALAKEAEERATKVGDDLSRAWALVRRGSSLLSLDQHQNAQQVIDEAEALFQKLNNDYGRAASLLCRGNIFFLLNQNQQALHAIDEAEALYKKLGHDLGRANSLMGRGNILFELDHHQDAVETLKNAEALFQKLDDKVGVGMCQLIYGQMAASEDRFGEAIEHFLDAYGVAVKLDYRFVADRGPMLIWKLLIDAGRKLRPDQFHPILCNAAPLVQRVGDDESVRSGLIWYVVSVLVLFGPERLLGMLPILESNLPISQTTLLRPARLAAEIQAGQSSAELPGETDEIRRAVRQVQERVDELKQAMEGSSKTAQKKRAKQGKERKRKS